MGVAKHRVLRLPFDSLRSLRVARDDGVIEMGQMGGVMMGSVIFAREVFVSRGCGSGERR